MAIIPCYEAHRYGGTQWRGRGKTSARGRNYFCERTFPLFLGIFDTGSGDARYNGDDVVDWRLRARGVDATFFDREVSSLKVAVVLWKGTYYLSKWAGLRTRPGG